jgi:hypothetical protein
MLLREEIPPELRPPAEAALAWLNGERGTNYALTGLADAQAAEAGRAPASTFELGLVLCEGDICAREQVSVRREGESYEFSFVEAPPAEIPALLDPPRDVRRRWLDQQLETFDFILLLFYRGRW